MDPANEGLRLLEGRTREGEAVDRLEAILAGTIDLDRTVRDHVADRAEQSRPLRMMVVPAVQGIEPDRGCERETGHNPCPTTVPQSGPRRGKVVMEHGTDCSWGMHDGEPERPS